MPFFVSSSDQLGAMLSGTRVQLSPGPTFIQYPDRFDNTVRTSKDGGVIVQVPVVDMRPRQWVWRNYKTTVPKYPQLYNQLLNYHYKVRQSVGLSPWVYLEDTETDNLTYRQIGSGNIIAEVALPVQVKIIQVTQNIAPVSGYPTYGTTFLEFIITDQRFNNF